MKATKIGILVIWALLVHSLLTPLAHAQENDPELKLAVEWMYDNWLTQYTNTTNFRPNDRLTRQEAAKFFVAFQQVANPNTPVPDIGCVFSDSMSFDLTLNSYIFLSCQMGLFKGTNGAFLPTQPLTKAQALTVLVRALEGSKDETVSPRWRGYFDAARKLWLTKEKNVMAIDTPITRYEMALLLYRAENGGVDPDQQEINELLEILLQLWIAVE